jgi:ribose transport system permease protein
MTRKEVRAADGVSYLGNAVTRFLGQNSILFVFIALVVFGAIVSPYFIKPRNIENLARNLPVTGLMAIGMTFVILTAGIDLSVGSILSLIVVVTAYHLNVGGTFITSILISLAIGLGIGIINGVIITKGRLEPFIVTLATLSIVGGSALIWTDGQPVSIGSSDQAALFAKLAPGNTIGIPTPMVIFIVLFLVALFIAGYTQLGRNIYAVGSNAEAARLTGINVVRTKIAVYAISGFLAGVASIIWASRLTTGSPVGGEGYELDAIACVVIGGTSLFGGEGSLVGTLLGILIVTVLNNLMNLLGIPPYSQKIAKGAIIALAVLIERQRELRREKTVVAKFGLQEQV